MRRLICLPSKDGPEYDMYVYGPEGMGDGEMLPTVNRTIDLVRTLDDESIKNGGDGVGATELIRRLEIEGFTSCAKPLVSNDWD